MSESVGSTRQFCILALLCLSTVHAALTTTPKNTAAVSGSQVILNCTSDDSVNITWSFNNIPIGSCNGRAAVPPYSLSKPIAEECDLIISPTSLAQAGQYGCASPTDAIYYAQLIIIDTPPVCAASDASGDVTVGEYITMTTADSYAAGAATTYDFNPSISWTSTGPTASFAFGNATFIGSTLVTQAVLPLVPQYTSQMDFSTPSDPVPPADTANNQPGSIQLCSFASQIVTNAIATTSGTIDAPGDMTGYTPVWDLTTNNGRTIYGTNGVYDILSLIWLMVALIWGL